MRETAYPYIATPESTNYPEIPLNEIKAYLKLSPNNNFCDGELALMCTTALDYAEKYTRQMFTPKIVTTNRCFWGEYRNGEYSTKFTLRRSPLIEVLSIKYDDNLLEAGNYQICRKQNNYSEILLTGDMPAITEIGYPIEIVFRAGYEIMPSDIKLALLQHIASMWLNRGDCDVDNYNKCPQICKDIYKKYKIIEVGA